MKTILQDLQTIALATTIAATPLIGVAAFATVELFNSLPASAQNYGNGYGYNNGIKNGYGSGWTTPPSNRQSTTNPYHRPSLKYDIRSTPGACARYVDC